MSEVKSRVAAEQDLTSAESDRLPRTALETVLVQIWTEVLQVDDVGVNDDFFDLNGQSLDAADIVALLHEVLQLPPDSLFESPIQAFFSAPTVASFAGELQHVHPDLEQRARLLLDVAGHADDDDDNANRQ